MVDYAASLARILAEIAAVARAQGRDPASVRLLAVSKAQPPAAIRALYAAGHRDFGENYAQELAAKAAALADLPDLRFHFIGALQANKLALIARTAVAVQSLGSERHARLLARHVAELGKAPYPVHLLVNAGNEATKSGVRLDAALPLARLIKNELPALHVRGVMAVPPPLADGHGDTPPLYRQLRELADQVGDGDLSLGMSSDLGPAVAAGSNCVRIGTALFGARPTATAGGPGHGGQLSSTS